VLALGVGETVCAEDGEPSLDVPEAYGSLAVADVAVDVEVVVVFFASWASAGSSPACSRRASTPKTATKLAIAPAAKRRALGTRRRRGGVRGVRGGGAAGCSTMAPASTSDLNSA
jgi:hypothetical protein